MYVFINAMLKWGPGRNGTMYRVVNNCYLWTMFKRNLDAQINQTEIKFSAEHQHNLLLETKTLFILIKVLK